MADIDIKVSDSTGLFYIQLDKWEWTGLTINGQSIAPVNNGDIQFAYTQTTAGTMHFIATADQNIILVNPGNFLLMENSAGTETFVCIISYETTSTGVTLEGIVSTVDALLPDALPSPLLFSQGRMTGHFELTS